MAKPRRKRCCFCPDLFWPHPRVKKRQRACRKPECQKKRRAETQQAWREKNPDYWTARRLRLRLASAKAAQQAAAAVRSGVARDSSAAQPPSAPPVPRELGALPWGFAHAELGVAATDFLVLVLKVVLRHVQDQIEAQAIDSTRVSGTLRRTGRQDQL